MSLSHKKIKREHHILPEFEAFLRFLAADDRVSRLIPGRISRKQSGTSGKFVSVSYETASGFKLLLKKGATVQEVFVTTSHDEKHQIIASMQSREAHL